MAQQSRSVLSSTETGSLGAIESSIARTRRAASRSWEDRREPLISARLGCDCNGRATTHIGAATTMLFFALISGRWPVENLEARMSLSTDEYELA